MNDRIQILKIRLKHGDELAEDLKERIKALESAWEKIIDSNIQILDEIEELERLE